MIGKVVEHVVKDHIKNKKTFKFEGFFIFNISKIFQPKLPSK
jgi:hypothetical protein